MAAITHKVEIPKKEFPKFLEEIVLPEIRKLNITDSELKIYSSKKPGREKGRFARLEGPCYIIDTKTQIPIVVLYEDGKLIFKVPIRYQYLGKEEHWTKVLKEKYSGKDN